MSFHRASLLGVLVLGLATFVGCQKEEPTQPPPPPAAAGDAAKDVPVEKGASSIEKGTGSEAGKDTTQKH